jgi:hypothetical protein
MNALKPGPVKTNLLKPAKVARFRVRAACSIFHPPPTIFLLFPLFLSSVANALAETRYAWQSRPSRAPPYASWATAATAIQDAVDAAVTGDEIVVTNGTNATGGRA